MLGSTCNNKKHKVQEKFLISSRKQLLPLAVFILLQLFSQKLLHLRHSTFNRKSCSFWRGKVANKCLFLFICLLHNLMCQPDRPSAPPATVPCHTAATLLLLRPTGSDTCEMLTWLAAAPSGPQEAALFVIIPLSS